MSLLGWILGGIAVAAGAAVLCYVIDAIVTDENIKAVAKQIIKELALTVAKVCVNNISGNTVSFDMLDSIGNAVKTVSLEGTGVSNEVYESETLYV